MDNNKMKKQSPCIRCGLNKSLIYGQFCDDCDAIKKTVSDMSGFNFIKNPFQKGTTIFKCFDGIFICETPEPDDRHKYQTVIREATNAESEYHNSKTTT